MSLHVVIVHGLQSQAASNPKRYVVISGRIRVPLFTTVLQVLRSTVNDPENPWVGSSCNCPPSICRSSQPPRTQTSYSLPPPPPSPPRPTRQMAYLASTNRNTHVSVHFVTVHLQYYTLSSCGTTDKMIFSRPPPLRALHNRFCVSA